MIANVKEILAKAKEGGYAVGAFNTVNLETTQAIIQFAVVEFVEGRSFVKTEQTSALLKGDHNFPSCEAILSSSFSAGSSLGSWGTSLPAKAFFAYPSDWKIMLI